MKWKKVYIKGLQGALTFLAASLTIQPGIIWKIIEAPHKAIHLCLGSLVAGFVVAFNNYWKHKKK